MNNLIQFIFPNEKYDEINNLKFEIHIKNNHMYFVEYDDTVSSIIKYAKYTHHPDSFVQIGRKIAEKISNSKIEADLITYVPMHVIDQSIRGFNQSMLLAREISSATGISLNHNVLRKVKKTKKQASLNAVMRTTNLHCAFVADDEISAGKNIIIVDDIYTTGATLNECKDELMDKMACSVKFLTITRKNI
ncbi:MAG: phosphoribosyltransferase family protein [Clostridia bacterium]|jgi:ComF family protein